VHRFVATLLAIYLGLGIYWRDAIPDFVTPPFDDAAFFMLFGLICTVLGWGFATFSAKRVPLLAGRYWMFVAVSVGMGLLVAVGLGAWLWSVVTVT
jgi:hypothetical protein